MLPVLVLKQERNLIVAVIYFTFQLYWEITSYSGVIFCIYIVIPQLSIVFGAFDNIRRYVSRYRLVVVGNSPRLPTENALIDVSPQLMVKRIIK